MAQMDPAGPKTVFDATERAEYPLGIPSIGSERFESSGRVESRAPRGSSSSTATLVDVLRAAADETATEIAAATKQTRLEVYERLSELTAWLVSGIGSRSEITEAPPVVAREYVSNLRGHLLAHLTNASNLNAHEVVHILKKLDEAEEGWRRTPRGRFIARLTGADCADAVVAIAHDIRSPLGSILLLVEALRRSERASPNPFRERQLGLIYGAAFGLSTTVSNLIAAARGDSLVQGKPAPFSIGDVLHSVSDIVQPMCEEKAIPLRVEFPRNDARVGFASAIQQVLLNLVSNGLRYTDAGAVSMGVTELSNDLVEFWVADTGPGIPDDVLERLCYGFPPEGLKLRFSSAGLGLAIVRTLVEAMGSTLQVDSGSEGTRFSFILSLPILQ